MNMVDAACTEFIWFYSIDESRKSPIAWEIMYLPKACIGLNLKNPTIWNKATIIWLLWSLENKNDRL